MIIQNKENGGVEYAEAQKVLARLGLELLEDQFPVSYIRERAASVLLPLSAKSKEMCMQLIEEQLDSLVDPDQYQIIDPLLKIYIDCNPGGYVNLSNRAAESDHRFYSAIGRAVMHLAGVDRALYVRIITERVRSEKREVASAAADALEPLSEIDPKLFDILLEYVVDNIAPYHTVQYMRSLLPRNIDLYVRIATALLETKNRGWVSSLVGNGGLNELSVYNAEKYYIISNKIFDMGDEYFQAQMYLYSEFGAKGDLRPQVALSDDYAKLVGRGINSPIHLVRQCAANMIHYFEDELPEAYAQLLREVMVNPDQQLRKITLTGFADA